MKMCLLFLFCTLYSSLGISQNAADMLKKVLEVNKKEASRSYELVFQLYRVENLTAPVETYYGSVVQNDKFIYQKIENTEVIQNSDIALAIDQDHKIIQLSRPSAKLANGELDIISKECDSVIFMMKNGKIELILNLSPFSQLPFSKVILTINSTSYRIENTVFHYSVLQNFSNDLNVVDQSYPVVSVTVKNYSLDISGKTDNYDLKRYIKKIEGRYVATSEFADYDIIDKR
jgi:hypothetical protein